MVTFGQVLLTRRELLPLDIADELAKLQDQVPPFGSAVAIEIIERELRKPVSEIFVSFERQPVASASRLLRGTVPRRKASMFSCRRC